MCKADYHVHSSFSLDSNVSMENIITHAISMGLSELAFTDHVDFDYPDKSCNFMIDYNEYLATFERLKNTYGQVINLILGVEVGYQPQIVDDIDVLLGNHPFDFVICSIHAMDGFDLHGGSFFKDKEKKIAYLRYFENVLECVKSYANFDVFGHIDYVNRYGNYADKTLSYDDYRDIIDTVLQTLIDKGKGIEVNTSGYRYGLNQCHPQLEVLKRYKELGGEIITVGSDAHSLEGICSHFDTAYNLLREVGFDHIVCFRQRKPVFMSIV